jgi:hypothetical protein
MRSIHDNYVYAYEVLCEARRTVLHTHFRDGTADEFTDVVFDGVEAHHFVCSLDGNILFDVSEVDVEQLVNSNADLFARDKDYGWPQIEYSDRAQLIAILQDRGIKGYVVASSYGLTGWVLASEMKQVERDGAWKSG